MNIKGKRTLSLVMALCFVMIFCFSTAVSSFAAGNQFASGKGTKTNPWHIKTAAQFNNVRKHLDGNFVLDNDIDLKGYKNFQPIGSFTPKSEKEPEQASPKTAFSGTFDGNGKTIKNLTMNGSVKQLGYGLFGTVIGTTRDLNVQNANVKASGGTNPMGGNGGVGAVVGLASGNAKIDGVKLIGKNKVTGNNMVGGLVGASNNKLIRNCTAVADVVLAGNSSAKEFTQCAGVLVGGDEGTSLENCHALGGTVTANGKIEKQTGINGLGGLAGCAIGAQSVLRCTAKNIVINANDYAMLIGGLAGFAGIGGGQYTLIKDCIVDNVTINAPANAERIGGIVGGGFYVTAYKQYYAVPTALKVDNCYATAKISGGRIVGSIAGYVSEDSTVTRSAANVTYKGAPLALQVGGNTKTIPISQVGEE